MASPLITTIAPTPEATAALGAWPVITSTTAQPQKTNSPPPPRCQNRALIYRDNPAVFGGRELDRIVPCSEPATVTRWSNRGTDEAERQRFCQAHADSLDEFIQGCRTRIDAAYAVRGEDPLDHHIGDRVTTPDGPGTVVFLPSAAWSDHYLVGLDSRRRGDRPVEYFPDQLGALDEPAL